MGIPATAKYMTCHTAIQQDSHASRKLARFHGDNRPAPWARVRRIPSYVYFSQKAHLVAGHDKLSKPTDISMGCCMTCHRAQKAPNDCIFRHEQKQ